MKNSVRAFVNKHTNKLDKVIHQLGNLCASLDAEAGDSDSKIAVLEDQLRATTAQLHVQIKETARLITMTDKQAQRIANLKQQLFKRQLKARKPAKQNLAEASFAHAVYNYDRITWAELTSAVRAFIIKNAQHAEVLDGGAWRKANPHPELWLDRGVFRIPSVKVLEILAS